MPAKYSRLIQTISVDNSRPGRDSSQLIQDEPPADGISYELSLLVGSTFCVRIFMSSNWQSVVDEGAQAFELGKYADAEIAMRKALEVAEKGGDELLVAVSLDNLAEVDYEQAK